MYVGTIEFDLLLGDVHSLKEKRSIVRPIVSELRRRFDVAAAEAGHVDLHRRALVGVAVVAATAGTAGTSSTSASGSSPADPRSTCCRRDDGCSVRTTEEERWLTRHGHGG